MKKPGRSDWEMKPLKGLSLRSYRKFKIHQIIKNKRDFKAIISDNHLKCQQKPPSY